VLTEDYAIKIARDWNVPASGSGFVTRFEVKRSFIAKYDVQEAGGCSHLEYWLDRNRSKLPLAAARSLITRNSRPRRSVSASSTGQNCRHCSGRR
jgi:hypothetical protein